MILDFFKKRTVKELVEEAKETYEPPKEEKKREHTFYRLGITDNDRVSFSMGYSEITMDAAGCDSLIAAITTFRDMLPKKEKKDE
jgi:hypothetical protein